MTKGDEYLQVSSRVFICLGFEGMSIVVRVFWDNVYSIHSMGGIQYYKLH